MNIKRTNVALGLFYSSMLVFFLGGGIAVMASVMWGPTAYHKPKMTVLLSIGGDYHPCGVSPGTTREGDLAFAA